MKCTLSQLVRKLHESSGCCPAACQILEADALARTCGGGAGRTGDYEVVQDIRSLCIKIGQGPGSPDEMGQGNRGTIESKREHFS